jgi:hypothetical protein
VCTPEEAPAAARRSAFPSRSRSLRGIAHKTESGGVALNLKSEAEVAAAARRMSALATEVLVEQMVRMPCANSSSASIRRPVRPRPGHRRRRRAHRAAEATRSRCCCPRTRAEIARSLSRLKVSTLIDGFRGRAGDRDAAIAAIEAVARFALDHAAGLEELDVNPLLVLARQGRRRRRCPDPMRRDRSGRRTTMTEPIIVETRGPVMEVTIDRPKANAIDAATSRIMGDVFATSATTRSCAAPSSPATGEKFFCPGWDLKAAAAGEAPDSDYGVGGFGGLQQLPGLNKPVICAVNGLAFGGGFEIALSADLILAAEHATFALPEINSGTVADAATIKLPRRMPYHVAMELLFTGRRHGRRGSQALGPRQRDRCRPTR